MQVMYNFYPTLLDAFWSYLNSSKMYQKFWGFSEDPSKTEEEYEKEQFQSLIDKINRVPFDSEAADKGTAFNEVVDCILLNKKSDKMELTSSDNSITAKYNNRTFVFDKSICKEFAEYYKDAIPQVYVYGNIQTKYGIVNVYGYLDELMPLKVHDIKTTTKYEAFKFQNNFQHIVYPYCLCQMGNDIKDFEYNILVWDKTGLTGAIITESYTYVPERDDERLRLHCELFIEFIEANKDLITDLKIFNKCQNQ